MQPPPKAIRHARLVIHDLDRYGLALELVEIAYYEKEKRDAAAEEYLCTRAPLEEIEARLT